VVNGDPKVTRFKVAGKVAAELGALADTHARPKRAAFGPPPTAERLAKNLT